LAGVAVILVLISCVLHAGWNLLVKRAGDMEAFTALYLLASSVLYLPMAIAFAVRHPVPAAGWILIAISGTLYAVYFVALGHAYRDADLSYAYPLARGIGPVLTVALGVSFLRERVTAAGLTGIALVLLAVVVLQAPAMRGGLGREMRRGACWASLVGLMYAAYSVVDKIAMARVGVHPVLYLYLAYLISTAVVTPVVVMRHGGRSLAAEWRANGAAATAVGLLNVGAYVLVLYAMAMPRAPVSYIVPLRTVSVLFGVAGGLRLLGEEGTWSRITAAVLIMLGVAAIAWKG